MSLVPGVRLGAYEVLALLGAGGMGEVYRARDTKLGRDVALKILPERFADDPDRLARFKREAHVLASLNHPNIAAIYGLEEADPSTGSGQVAVRALVLELVEGPTLADRLAQRAIPLDETLHIARQIAEALEAAHERSIVHRDLKPSNITLRPDGTVKVLDFGLAKALDPTPSGTDVSQSPTITSPAATRVGAILGTAAYMAPEQARGKALDKRVDIWAFGCVLYEMLTGRRAFGGDDVSDVLASVLAREPDFASLPADTPPSIRRLLRRCLEKDRSERLHDIGDARLEIQDAQAKVDPHAAVVGVPPTRHRKRERLAWIAALAVLGLALVVSLMFALRPPPAAPETRLDITTPPTTDPVSLAISPDGHKIVAPIERVTAQGRTLTAWTGRGAGWSHEFSMPILTVRFVSIGDLDGDAHPEVLAAVAFRDQNVPQPSDELVCFSTEGELLWRVKMDDVLLSGSGPYGPPWASGNLFVYKNEGATRIAWALHHHTWWPAMVVLLDHRGQPLGKFFNAGWIGDIAELGKGKFLLLGGVNNGADAGMFAVLDEWRISGSSPEASGTDYWCENCPRGGALRYFVFPRSELNRLNGSGVNRATVEVFDDRVQVLTLEEPSPRSAGVIYEFTRDFVYRRARASDEYWNLHRSMSLAGKVGHRAEDCPERARPRLIRSWSPEHGWRELLPMLSPGRSALGAQGTSEGRH